MTTYRDRHLAGLYDPKKQAKAQEKAEAAAAAKTTKDTTKK